MGELERLDDRKRALARHPVFSGVTGAEALRTFVEHHVIAVWDFMWLLASLRRDLCPVEVPWVPPPDPEAARLLNEIALGEETDRPDGRTRSHFEWYLEAMEEVGADTGPIRRAVAAVRSGRSPRFAVSESGLPAPAVAFARETAAVLAQPVHVRAAVFFHAREDLIPGMFRTLVGELARSGVPCSRLAAYLHRHVEVDEGEHGPAASRLVERRLAAAHPPLEHRRAEALTWSLRALDARLRLWDGILHAVTRPVA